MLGTKVGKTGDPCERVAILNGRGGPQGSPPLLHTGDGCLFNPTAVRRSGILPVNPIVIHQGIAYPCEHASEPGDPWDG